MDPDNYGTPHPWLEERIARIPRALEDTLSRPLPAFEASVDLSWEVFGVGGSEGPARLMVACLQRHGIAARLASVSRFIDFRPRERTGLIVFSQGLSPHARRVLSHANGFDVTWVFSACSPAEVLSRVGEQARRRVVVFGHAPKEEEGSLLRLVGPTCAAALGVRVVASLCGGVVSDDFADAVPALLAYYSDGQRGRGDSSWHLLEEIDPTFCLAAEEDLPFAHQAMWKWQEAMCAPLPPVIEAFSFAHGPFQAIYREPAVLLCVKGASQNRDEVWSRLQRILVPNRHRVVDLSAASTFPYSYFELDAKLSSLLSRLTQARALDPQDWPGKDADRALYDLE